MLSLFSGGGLGDYGLSLAGMEIAGQVEIDEYCQKILNLRWPNVPKWRDIKNVTGKEVVEKCGRIDLVSGGFPCQPFSVAGTRSGESDSRHLWPEMLRVIREVRPRWVLAENVSGLLSISDGRVFGEVVRGLASCGYVVEWDCIPASAVGAPHQRDRVWILAHATSKRTVRKTRKLCEANGRSGGSLSRKSVSSSDVSDPESIRTQRRVFKQGQISKFGNDGNAQCLADPSGFGRNKGSNHAGKKRKETWRNIACECGEALSYDHSEGWRIEPAICRMAHGVANRVDRLKLLGNGQVVQVVQFIGEKIIEFDRLQKQKT